MKLRNSLIAFVGFLALIGSISLVTPTAGRGQGPNGPPTQDVNVVNTPSVNVANTVVNPVPVRNVDNGRQPFHEKTHITLTALNSGESTPIFVVPTGKRFVTESVSVYVNVAPVVLPNRVEVHTQLGNNLVVHEIAVARQGSDLNGNAVFTGTHAVTWYADPGTEVIFQFSRGNTTDSATAEVTISGYFVDVP